MLGKIRIPKYISRSLSYLLNKSWFWWSLFIFTILHFWILFYSLDYWVVIGINKLYLAFILVLNLAFYAVLQFTCPNIATNIDIYGHWRGKEVAENLKIHSELNELRDAMLFGDQGGEKYWQILEKLAEIF